VTEIVNMAVIAHALQAVQARLKSVCNETYFTFEAGTVFCPYLPSFRSGVVKICQFALPAEALRALRVRFKSVGNEVYFTLEAEIFYCA
jgi:hypothetical protein